MNHPPDIRGLQWNINSRKCIANNPNFRLNYYKLFQEEKAKKPKEETDAQQPQPPTPEEMLSKTASLLEELKRVQHERLSSTPPQHFSSIPKAGEKECKLASIQNVVQSQYKFIVQRPAKIPFLGCVIPVQTLGQVTQPNKNIFTGRTLHDGFVPIIQIRNHLCRTDEMSIRL